MALFHLLGKLEYGLQLLGRIYPLEPLGIDERGVSRSLDDAAGLPQGRCPQADRGKAHVADIDVIAGRGGDHDVLRPAGLVLDEPYLVEGELGRLAFNGEDLFVALGGAADHIEGEPRIQAPLPAAHEANLTIGAYLHRLRRRTRIDVHRDDVGAVVDRGYVAVLGGVG